MISSGAKKDLLVLGLTNALIMICRSEDVKKDEHLIRLSNKTHKINKKVWYLLDEMSEKLKQTQDKVYKESSNPFELGLWVKKNLNNRIMKVLNLLDKNTNLELLCNQLLFSNFCERDKTVMECMKWLQEKSQHFEVFDLLSLTNASECEESTFRDAEMAINIIKS